jgi:hypothetical protein
MCQSGLAKLQTNRFLGGKMKKLTRIAAIISAIVLVPVVPAFAYDFVPTGYNLEKSGKIAFTVEDQPDGPVWISLAIARGVAEAAPPQRVMMCRSFTEDDCAKASLSDLSGTSILPVCQEQMENCLAGLKIYKDGEAPVDAQLIKVVPGLKIPTVPALGNPQGSSPTLWESETLHAGGSGKYVVSPQINFNFREGQLQIQNFSAAVYPIVDKFASNYVPAKIRIVTENGVRASNHENGENTGNDQCVATDLGWCAYRSDFAVGTRIELKLRLSNQVTGWLHGRLKAPQITVSRLDANYNEVTIAANPVEIPMLYAAVESKGLPEQVLKTLNTPGSWGGLHQKSELWSRLKSDDVRAQDLITRFAPVVKDTVAETYTSWQVKSIASYTNPSPCIQDSTRLVGLVTTNAMSYNPGTPSWDGETLSYRVAGLHFMPDGKTAVEGTYELAIRSDAARCLYGFSKAPVNATVSVIGEGGENKVATTVISEKDGWLKLAAYGFTFSSPTISVKLTQAKAPAKKTTITCFKGKLTKKVTAVSPKCPAGYKKK